MTRFLYRCLLYLHPPAFRKNFGDEMLWIFDQSVNEYGVPQLLLDAMASLLRRWLLRSAIWRVLAALAGACLTIAAGLLVRLPQPSPRVAQYPLTTPQTFLLLTGIALMTVFSLTLILGVTWFRFSRRRCA